MENKICVYAICKNEFKFVERWYNSMKEADLVVVLDTGSTDDTIEKLEDVGVDIVESKVIKPWRFDVARNESLKLIPKEYNILVCTDLDEVFEPGWANKVKKAWNDGIERIEYKYTWSHFEDGRDNLSFIYNKIHSRKWKWVHAVHESLAREIPDTKEGEAPYSVNYTKDESVTLYDSIHLHHYPDGAKSRSTYLDLLKLRVDDEPYDWYGKFYLAREYYFHGMYSEAMSLFNAIISKYNKHYTPIVVAYSFYIVGNCFREMIPKLEKEARNECFQNAIKAYSGGIKFFPTYIPNYVGLSYIYNEMDLPNIALSHLKKAINTCIEHDHWLEDKSNWTYELFMNLAISNNLLGNKVEALGYAALALNYAPNNEIVKKNYDVCLNDIVNVKELV